jgi:simple sugar transport system permease protein
VRGLLVTTLSLAVALLLFGAFAGLAGAPPLELYYQMYRGAFGSWFSLQNTLQRAAPLMLTALCTALPARLGLVIIGGEGALVLGGLAAAVVGHALSGGPAWLVEPITLAAGAAMGAAWIALAGWLRARRGVNETIGSLLLGYIAIAVFNHLVEGPLRDPASLNKPSTAPIEEAYALGDLPGMDVHYGLLLGVVVCLAAYVLAYRTVFGFATAMIGGNARAAQLAGLPVARLVVVACALGGAAAGLAGAIEVLAVHHAANASLIAGYGYTGFLVAFLARQNPLGILPASILLGGVSATGGLLQRSLKLPDAAVLVLQGFLFLSILASETLYGRTLPRWVKRRRAMRVSAREAEA